MPAIGGSLQIGHRRAWGKHCHRHNACGVPVYFAQDRWTDEPARPHRHGSRRDPIGATDPALQG